MLVGGADISRDSLLTNDANDPTLLRHDDIEPQVVTVSIVEQQFTHKLTA